MKARLGNASHTAFLTPVFADNSPATDATTGQPVTLGLTDTDSNGFMPAASPRFAGQLVTISQGDGQMIFASRLRSTPRLILLNLTDNVPGNVPPADGMAVATTGRGTLYVVDNKAGTITALDTRGWLLMGWDSPAFGAGPAPPGSCPGTSCARRPGVRHDHDVRLGWQPAAGWPPGQCRGP